MKSSIALFSPVWEVKGKGFWPYNISQFHSYARENQSNGKNMEKLLCENELSEWDNLQGLYEVFKALFWEYNPEHATTENDRDSSPSKPPGEA